MTGYFEIGGSREKISKITVGGLQDLGYSVHMNRADYFSKYDLNPSCRCNRRLGEANITAVRGIGHDRQLSESGLADVVAFGKERIQEVKDANAAAKRTKTLDDKNDETEEDFVDLGEEMIVVLYKEGDVFYNVIVTADGE